MRFIKADQIFSLAGEPVKNGVLVLDENGTVSDILPHANDLDAQKLETFPGFILPGFVNAHCHLELSHLKNKIEKHSGLPEFAQQVVLNREANKENVLKAMQLADEEMYNEGIVAVGDISNCNDSFETKKHSKIYYHTFIELIGFNPAKAENIFRNGIGLLNELRALGLNGSLAPHAPYSVSPELMRKISTHCKQNHFPSSIHNQECEDENLFFQNKSGKFLELYSKLGINISFFLQQNKNSIQFYITHLKKIEKLLLVHNTYSTPEDILFAAKNTNELFLCCCINANLFIENKFPDLNSLMKSKVKFTVGTDSLAGNDSLSILSELKTIHKLFPGIELNTLFTWACRNGAKALGIENVFGSFEKGRKPGVLNMSFPEGSFEKSTIKRLV